MAKRKPKPATAGEKIVMAQYGCTMLGVRESNNFGPIARSIDRAIARAVKRERRRCAKIARLAWDYQTNRLDAWQDIRDGVQP